MNFLEEPLIRVDLSDGSSGRQCLPEIFASASSDRIARFPALRPHQAPAFHAFLVQLAVMACDAAGLAVAPGEDASAWAAILRALTPDHPDDAPWRLVGPADRPALLQAPAPDGDLAAFKTEIASPDALDLLVTSKNHDLKAARMYEAVTDDWFFALLSLQTQEGFLGAGNYGIARMNGGFGSRSYMRLAPAGAGFGGQIMRDIRILLEDIDRIGEDAAARGLMKTEAMALTWLEPWDGIAQIGVDRLHPLFVEICRRIRLVAGEDGRLTARAASSKATRIDSKSCNGVLGDPWTPVENSDPPKALSITEDGFSYRKTTELLFGAERRSYERPRLARVRPSETGKALVLRLDGLARGQGKTDGYHSRSIPILESATIDLDSMETAAFARARVRTAGDVAGKALRPALIVLVQKGPEAASWSKKSNDALVGPAVRDFDQHVDAIFFDHLWTSLGQDRDAAALDWARTLAGLARTILSAAAAAGPQGAERRIIAIARARNALEGALNKLFPNLRASSEATFDAA